MNKKHKYFKAKKHKEKLNKQYDELRSYNPCYSLRFYIEKDIGYVKPIDIDEYGVAVKSYKLKYKKCFKKLKNKQIRAYKKELRSGNYYRKVQELRWVLY